MDKHEWPAQIGKPMEEPEEAGAGARSPSPEYRDLTEADILMKEAEEAGAAARSPSTEYKAARVLESEPQAQSRKPGAQNVLQAHSGR